MNGVRYFPKGIFPKGDFPCINFPSGNLLIVQFPKRQLPKGEARHCEPPQAAIGTLRIGWARDRVGPSSEARTDIWEVVAWEIAHLGSCHLGKYSWENAFRKSLNIQ